MIETAKKYYTIEEYMALEAESEQKHEYYQGEIYAMAGAQMPHNRISGSIYRHIGNALEGGPCEPFNSDQRVYVEAKGFVTLPDVSVAYNPESI